MEKIEKLQPRAFTRFCMTIGAVPSSYLDGMTIERQLLWLCSYLEKEVIPAVNQTGGAVEELQALYTQLLEYVNNYFENLDVQEEINNKLDEMAEDGTLAEIIAQYIQLQGILSYNSVEDLKAAENLVDGSFVQTYGYYSYGDGGASKYKVREVTNQDTEDDMFIIALHDTNLVAEFIPENNEINLIQVGGKKDDNTFDNTSKLVACIKKANESKEINKIFIPSGQFYFSTSINFETNNINLKSIDLYGASSTEPGNNSATIIRYSGSDYFLNINDAFNGKIHDIYIKGNDSNNGIYAENTFWTDFYNLYFINMPIGIMLDGYNAYDHIYNNTFVNSTAGYIGVKIGTNDSTYPRNYTEYIWINKNHFEMGDANTIGVKAYAAFFLYISENDFSNTTGVAISLDARSSTVAHNIQDIFIESNSFAKCTTCVDIQGGMSGSTVSKIKIDGDYNNPLNRSGYKILNAVRGSNGGYLGYVTVTGMVTDYIASEKWIRLDNCPYTDIDINNIAIKNIDVVSGEKPNFIIKQKFDTDMIYKNISENVTATVSEHSITYDFSQAIADLDCGILIASGTVDGTSNSCVFSAVINRGTRYGSTLLDGKGANISSITATGLTLTVNCSSSYTPSANVTGVKFTFLK